MKRLLYYAEVAKKLRPASMGPKLWNYLKYRFSSRNAVLSVRRYTPQIVCLLLTNRCNLNCSYCNAGKILDEGKTRQRENEATLEKVQRIFENPWFANALFVDLQGGEPLLVKDLDRIIVYLSKQGRMTNTSTNGLLLAERILDLKRAGISRINVSLYEANRSILERDLSKINSIFPVHATYVLLRSEVEKQPEKILKIARFIRESGCRSLRFFMYRPMGFNPKPDEILLESHPSYREFRSRAEEALPGFCFFPPLVRKEGVRKLCPQLWQRTGCDMSGQMIVCCGMNTLLGGASGNLFEAGIDAYNHPLMVDMRKQLMDPEVDPPEICKDCNLLGDPGW